MFLHLCVILFTGEGVASKYVSPVTLQSVFASQHASLTTTGSASGEGVGRYMAHYGI